MIKKLGRGSGNKLSSDILAEHRSIRDAEIEKELERIELGICPKCEPSVYLHEIEGCNICLNCGWSACDN